MNGSKGRLVGGRSYLQLDDSSCSGLRPVFSFCLNFLICVPPHCFFPYHSFHSLVHLKELRGSYLSGFQMIRATFTQASTSTLSSIFSFWFALLPIKTLMIKFKFQSPCDIFTASNSSRFFWTSLSGRIVMAGEHMESLKRAADLIELWTTSCTK